jgi:hypothetical protein
MRHQPFICNALIFALAAMPAALLILGGAAQADPDTINTANNAIVSSGDYSEGVIGYLNEGTDLTVVGGRFDQDDIGFDNMTAASATINDGMFNDNSTGVLNLGTLNIKGGDFTGNPGIDIDTTDTGVTDIFGTSFSTGFGELPAGTGSFTGTLKDGTTETLSYTNQGSIDLINSAPAPELGSSASFGLLLMLGAVGVGLRSRKGRREAARRQLAT